MRQCQLIVERKLWKLFRINQGNFVAADGILGFDFSQNSDVWITEFVAMLDNFFKLFSLI